MNQELDKESYMNPDLIETTAMHYRDFFVFACQTNLVNWLLRKGQRHGWSLDNIWNLQPAKTEGTNGLPPATHSVQEWWMVHERLGGSLMRVGVPVLHNEDGTWWGRTCTGSDLLLDGALQEVAKETLYGD